MNNTPATAHAANAASNTAPDEAETLRAADAWDVQGFSVWETVQAQIAADPKEDLAAESLLQTVRDLQDAVALLQEKVRALQAAPPVPASQDSPPRASPPLRPAPAFTQVLPADLAPFYFLD